MNKQIISPGLDLGKLKYKINKVEGFTLTEFCRAMKTKYETFEEFHKAKLRLHTDLLMFIEECWKDIEPFTFQDALTETNTEKRRVLFQCIGPEKVFKQANAKLINKQVINKTRYEWDKKGVKKVKTFEDTYELYAIPSKTLFNVERNPRARWGSSNIPENIYAVRCWCTTTAREYWIMVKDDGVKNNDAIEAIAWTMQFPEKIMKDIIRIYRQGDILIAQTNTPHTEIYPQYYNKPLSKEQYLTLMYSET